MKTMKVMRFNDSPDAPALVPGTAPVPQPGPGEMLIRVHAAGVTPTELYWHPTTHTREGATRTGAIVGHEFSGTVEAVGPDVDPGQSGSEVYGMNDWFAEGATAEYCVTSAGSVAVKPSRLSHLEAASVPIGALTAWQGLFDRAKLRAGERVLIHGGSGSVGAFAVQLARRQGAHVIATASARNLEFVAQLGAGQVLDYKGGPFERSVQPVDVVFDTVGGPTLQRSWDLLNPGGRVVTIVSETEAGPLDKDLAPAVPGERTAAGSSSDHREPNYARLKAAFFIVEPNQGQLAAIAGLLDAGDLKTFVGGVFPLARASEAYCGKPAERRGRGKLVIAVIDGPTS